MSYQGMDEDRRLILAAADELEQYLDSSVVLWRVLGSKQPLSPGNLLFALALMKNLSKDPELSGSIQKINNYIDTHRHAWQKRIEKEIPLRLNQYRMLVEDYLDAGKIDAGYRNNISTRVKLELLFGELAVEPAGETLEIAELDRSLFTLLVMDEFIWEPLLRPSFEMNRFGYLYVREK